MLFEPVVQGIYGALALVGAAVAFWLVTRVGKMLNATEPLMIRLTVLLVISLLLLTLFSMVSAYFPELAVISNGVALFFLGCSAGIGMYSLNKIARMGDIQKA